MSPIGVPEPVCVNKSLISLRSIVRLLHVIKFVISLQRHKSGFGRQIVFFGLICNFHIGRQTIFSKRVSKHCAYLIAFVSIINLVAAYAPGNPGFRHTLCISDGNALIFECKVTCWRCTGVEMLMKPHIGWNDHAANFPVITLWLLAFRPHQTISFTGKDYNMCAGPMSVTFFISAGGKLADMTVHRTFCQLEAD